MPNIADIIIKKSDGTTSVTWAVQTPGSGESPASWKSASVNVVPALCPEMRLRATSRLVKAVPFRDINVTVKWPKVTTVNGVTTTSDGLFFQAQFHVNQTLTVDEIKEMVYQAGNLIVADLVRQCTVSGTGAY